jgi:hypothetical protein
MFIPSRNFLRVLALALLLISPNLRAQGVNSAGTDFWCGFMPNFAGGVNVTQLFLASGTSNTVSVTVNGTTTTYTLIANQGITVDLGGQGVSTFPETPSASSVHVVSTAPLTMYGYNVWNQGGGSFRGGSPDGYLALPTAALGTEYYTVNYYDASFSNTPTVGEFVIIAPQDSTLVTIKTAAHTRNAFGVSSHNPGDTWTVQLMKGESYLVQSTGLFVGVEDLTGSHIVSNKPIALLSGHQIAPVTVAMTSADHLIEMVPPIDKWGTQYFDMPMAGRTKCGDYIRILSCENGNQITYNGKGPLNLDAGKWAELTEVTQPTVFTSTNHKKFIVAQYSYSNHFDADPGLADPFLILFTPQENFEKKMIFRTPLDAVSGTFTNYITIIANKDSLLNIQINGQPIGTGFGATEQIFPGTNMAATRINLATGSNTYLATANTPFGMYQYGFSDYEGYGWPTGEALNIHSADTLPPVQVVTNSCHAYNVHLMEDRHIPAFSFEDTHIAEVDFITVLNDPRWPKPSTNFTFILDTSFHSGDSTANYTLAVINPANPAYAAVYVADKAGNDTVYQYTYTPSPNVNFTFNPPAPFQFGKVILGNDSCRTITVTNPSANDVPLIGVDILGVAQHGKYGVTPAISDTTVKAGGSLTFSVCFTPDDITGWNYAFDSLTVRYGSCDSVHYGLSGRGVSLEGSVGVSTGIKILAGLHIFPNPSSGSVTVAFGLTSASVIEVQLYDVAGRLWWYSSPAMFSSGNQILSLDLSGIPDGRYFLRLDADGNSTEEPLTILH